MDISQFCPPGVTVKDAEAAGRDAALNGSNTTNTHFKFFTKPELTSAWERGKASPSGDGGRNG